MQLKILSWNIWVKGYFDEITDFLNASNANIIGLQEVQANDPERDIIGYLNRLGYHHIFAPIIKKVWHWKMWNDGPAIFSKTGFDKTKIHTLSERDNRAAVQADILVEPISKVVFEQYPHACKMHKPEKIIGFVFVSSNEAAVIL